MQTDLEAESSRFIEVVLPFSVVLQYRKGETVPIKEAQSRCLYYVEKGAVEVSHTVRETRVVVALIGEGNFFGEIGFFDGVSRVRDIRATADAVIRVFDLEGLRQLQRTDPLLYGNFLTHLAQLICAKFRRILEEREPLTAYAASLSTGRRSYEAPQPLPDYFFQTPEWIATNRIVEDFKAHFFELSYRLQKDPQSDIPWPLQEKCYTLLTELNNRLQESEKDITTPGAENYVWGYVFKELFPYFMRSRFAERAYFKPKGYAGDFLMMEMIYRNEPQGDGKLGILVDHWYLNQPASMAVRGRRQLLGKQLETLCGQRANGDSPIRIMNLACGSNRELFDFLSRCHYTEKIEALCVDIDPEALEYTDRHVNVFHHNAGIRLMNDNIVKWSLGRVRHDFGLQDIIYSAGITDYLDNRLFTALITRCYDHLKPGGTLIIGNFSMKNPNRVFMDQVLQWRLIHRDEQQLRDLFAASPFGDDVLIKAEEQGVNLFVVATKTR